MKRPVAVVLAIAIVGAVAFCFLRPVPGEVPFIVEGRSDTVYTFTEPQPFEARRRSASRRCIRRLFRAANTPQWG